MEGYFFDDSFVLVLGTTSCSNWLIPKYLIIINIYVEIVFEM